MSWQLTHQTTSVAGPGKTPVPRLSIVIPCYQDADRFEATLASVLQNRPDDCEVLVVQPRAYTDPYELKDEVRFVEAPNGSSLVDLINLGIQMAQGALVHLLTCDIEVWEGWTEPAVAHFHDVRIASVSPLVVNKGTRSLVVARGVRYGSGGTRRIRRAVLARRRAQGGQVLGPTLAAGFYRRQALVDVGGFRRDVGVELVDVDISLRLQAAGYRCVHEAASLVTTEESVSSQALSFQSGREAELFFWCHAAQSGWVPALLMHPCSVVLELVGNLFRPQILLRMLGRVAACLEQVAPGRQAHCQHVQQPVGEGNMPPVLPLKPSSSPEQDTLVNSRAAA